MEFFDLKLFVLEFRNGDLTTDNDDVALHEGFAGDAAFQVDLEAGVEDGVGDGIGNFIRMAFADGLGREDVRAGHGGGRVGYIWTNHDLLMRPAGRRVFPKAGASTGLFGCP